MRVSLYSPGCSGTWSSCQAGLELGGPPASASTSQVLGRGVPPLPGRMFKILSLYNFSIDIKILGKENRVGNMVKSVKMLAMKLY